MKKITLLTCLLAAGFLSRATNLDANPPAHVHIVSKRMDVFYFKVDRQFIGADLEIYSTDGKKLFTQKVEHRKVLIDFYYEEPGKYIIFIQKGDVREEFEFSKDNRCLETERPTQLISVVQGV